MEVGTRMLEVVALRGRAGTVGADFKVEETTLETTLEATLEETTEDAETAEETTEDAETTAETETAEGAADEDTTGAAPPGVA